LAPTLQVDLLRAPASEGHELMPGKRKAIIVAGMHRSGTSALTRIVNLLGADLAVHLVPGGIGNELGHWESRAVQDLHNGMLAELRSDIYSPVNFPQSWFDGASAKVWIDRIEALVLQEYSASRLFVLKDPRIVLFVPLWIAALNRLAIEPHFIIPFRHPLAVAASLEMRERRLNSGDPVPLAQGVVIWLRYTLAAEKYSRGQKRAFVAFDMLLTDWQRELARIGHQLDVSWPRFGTSRPEIDLFLDSSHRNVAPIAASDDRVRISRSILNVYDGLNHAVTDPQTTPTAFRTAAENAAVAEDVLGAYALIKENQVAVLREEINATRSRHATEAASAHRAFETEIRARDSRIADATTYARSLEQNRDETLRHAKALELRVAELSEVRTVACKNAKGSKDNREESH
jgi:hypothetical protein